MSELIPEQCPLFRELSKEALHEALEGISCQSASFDKGETLSGVPYDLGLECVEELKKLFGTDDIAPIAIRWILMHEAVSVVIPGASRAAQLKENIRAAELPALTDDQMKAVQELYDKKLHSIIHPQW